MKVVAFLPAKGSSERISSKNKKIIAGKPLFLNTLEKLMECDFIDEVYLDTESEEMIEMAQYTDCKILKRDIRLANNSTDGHQLFYNEAKQVDADIYIQILCTSPFIKKETIKKGIDILKNKDNYDSVVLVKKEKQYRWEDGKPSYDIEHIPNSFELKDTVVETMGLYITKKSVALNNKKRFGDNVYLLESEAIESVDVNYPDEFELAELIMLGNYQKEIKLFNLIKTYINSAVVSDILDDLGVDGVVNGLKSNIKGSKLFGRAKTLGLRKLNENEDYRGIYNALNSYKLITYNDIIVVENECNKFAYFGELNADLAIRSGASGVVINGVTRDSAEVIKKNLPVFSRGNNCKDVRYRATVDSINKTINLGSVKVNPGDLVFADDDGTVIIPKNIENEVIKRIFDSIEKEQGVRKEIFKGSDALSIIDTIGFF